MSCASRRRHQRGALRRGGRRYGGLLVHVGLGVLAAGIIASSGLGEQSEVTLAEGQSVAFGGHDLRYDGLTTTREPQRTVLTTRLSVTDGPGAAAGAADTPPEPVSRRVGAHRLTVDRPGTGVGPLRLGDRRCNATASPRRSGSTTTRGSTGSGSERCSW